MPLFTPGKAPPRSCLCILFHGTALFHFSLLIRGQRAPVVGRVCMDQLMVDVTHIPGVQPGDSVVVFGKDGGAAIPVEEFASFSGTVNYESICSIGTRVPRVYLRGGQTVDLLEYLSIK